MPADAGCLYDKSDVFRDTVYFTITTCLCQCTVHGAILKRLLKELHIEIMDKLAENEICIP
jgi:hypothetical protein